MSDPSVDYLLFCDKVLTDRSDGKETFVGLFQSLHTKQFPLVTTAFLIKIAIDNFRYQEGISSAVVNVKHPRTGAVIGSAGARLDQIPNLTESQKAPVRFKLGLTMKSLTFTEPGKYEVQCLLGNEIIASRILHVLLVNESKSPK